MTVHALNALPNGTPLHNGAYLLQDCLGQGGFGITYRARDTILDRFVAIKEFFPMTCRRVGLRLAVGPGWKPDVLAASRNRFFDEGKALVKLDHPGIVQVYYGFQDNETAYLVMKLLEGQTLEEYLHEEGGPLPVKEAVEFIRQVGEALTEVHRVSLLHRDLKPSNIMRQKNGQITLIDFGAAREFIPDAVHSQSAILSRGYAPPEQYIRQGKRGPFTDVYALAATLYHLLTEEAPMEAVFRMTGEPIPTPVDLMPEIPRALSDAVMQGLALKAEDRPATVAAFVEAILSACPDLRKAPNAGEVRLRDRSRW